MKQFVNFRKVRAMTRDVDTIAKALTASQELILSQDHKNVGAGSRFTRPGPLPALGLAACVTIRGRRFEGSLKGGALRGSKTQGQGTAGAAGFPAYPQLEPTSPHLEGSMTAAPCGNTGGIG